jgi:signal recognition particle GTPase
MSRYAGEDLFGSGPHTIHMGEDRVDQWQQSFHGQNFVLNFTGGYRGTVGMIKGTLKAESAEGIETLIDTITRYIAAGVEYTLVDNFGRTWNNVVLMSPFKRLGQLIPTSSPNKYHQDYEVGFMVIRK